MINIFSRTKILAGLITGGILLSSVSNAFAATVQPLNIYGRALLTNERKLGNVNIKQGLDKNFVNPVAPNTITADQANKIKAIISKPQDGKKINLEKTKTMAEQDPKIHKYSNNISYINPLTNLVDNGTITQVQADKIIMKQIYLLHEKMLKSY
ncbi:hypothetical protein K9O30_07865 [Clostridium bowmanii]|uniref:hypothetical protein n=1 Tax=Clostridium bowmanii TaxID=132925 RepID=UPI001C0CC0C7|nr:hypothetical protein [Clostridium bowmanii]MBU3188947.1 hypothetical protein [Clostridium bowmanii]MCA1073644.1 hypothetical protein [Clostridium bowmanii]